MVVSIMSEHRVQFSLLHEYPRWASRPGWMIYKCIYYVLCNESICINTP